MVSRITKTIEQEGSSERKAWVQVFFESVPPDGIIGMSEVEVDLDSEISEQIEDITGAVDDDLV